MNTSNEITSFAINAFEQKCVEIGRRSGSGKRRYCVKNAFVHLEKAWALRDKDVEMTLFRCITAEEELATALMLLLKEKKYKNAEFLQEKQHPYKNAILPYARSIWSRMCALLRDSGIRPVAQIRLVEGKDRIIAVVPDALVMEEERLAFIFEEPLNIAMSREGTPLSFKTEFAAYLRSSEKHIFKKMQQRGNRRNLLLYASETCAPEEGPILPENVFDAMKANVFTLLYLYLLIEPHETAMPLVEDALQDFLGMMSRASLPLTA